MPFPWRSAGTESEIPWIPRCSDVVELGWGVGQWLGSQILGGVDIVNIKTYQFSLIPHYYAHPTQGDDYKRTPEHRP